MSTAPQTVHLKDYTPPAFLVDLVELDLDFRAEGVIVRSRLALRRNPAAAADAELQLDGNELETLAVCVDGRTLAAGEYQLDADHLRLTDLPAQCTLQLTTRIQPDRNTKLSGLYRSANGYFTQCEAQGFRRITWFPDRPDVMSRYTVTLHADRASLPVLLANGNPVASGEEPEQPGRHWARWEDPFPKPAYLFAVVAADLDVLRDRYRTVSGREVQLAIYVEPGKLDQCPHAMAALQKSMAWDEQRFGLECDLDHYMIVAVGDFNMGAMENKGLNIFNTKYVLARPDVATDLDYENIDRVVAHEYFHNWTGNRVTCRDWFQLSLKEGLTVFRDQEFGADVHHRSIARIREVRGLRASQFPEDAGPMAHPVRPASYIEINNFYTATVYQKGAEVVRMIQTLIGPAAFRRGMDEYFRRHDGQAVTCDDFVAAMSAVSGQDFGPFMAWYDQAGTPRLAARGEFDAARGRYTLRLAQSGGQACTSSSADQRPYHIPVRLGLLDAQGRPLPLRLAGESESSLEKILSLTTPEAEFVFEGLPADAAPVPSLLRDFSAPVHLDFPYSDAELALLLAHDSDPFNRWEAGQRLAGRLILAAAARLHAGQSPDWPEHFVSAAERILAEAEQDPAFAAEALVLPGEATLAEEMDEVDPDALHAARNGLRLLIAERLRPQLLACYQRFAPDGPYQPSAADAGRRALRNLCLSYLCEGDKPADRERALAQFSSADNMTDQYAALLALTQSPSPERDQALEHFHQRWQHEALVIDKWLLAQSGSRASDTLERVRALVDHPAFDRRNPNKVYALLRGFGANHVRFHSADGAGYRFIAEQIQLLDPANPQVASRLARCFDRWKKFDPARQAHARHALETLRQQPGLSADVFEVVNRALG